MEAVAGRAFALATEELSATAERVERGLADAVLAVYADADNAVAAAARACERLTRELGGSMQPRIGLATARSRWASGSKALPPCSRLGESVPRSRARSSPESERLRQRARTRSGSAATATS